MSTEQSDPMRMADQPALQTSSGAVWIVMGALVLLASGFGLGFLAFAEPERPSRLVALVSIFVVAALYVLLIVLRFTGKPGPARLKRIAACFLGMLGIALLAAIVCAGIEWAAVGM